MKRIYPGSFTDDLTVRVDEPGGGITYIGFAPIATAESDASWQIFKITESGASTNILYADGNSAFDNVWDDRTGLSYS